jgi:hypothetical protein
MTPIRQPIPETIVAGKRLGRHVYRDPYWDSYPPETAAQIVSVTHQGGGLPLNQGDVGSCSAEALCGALNTMPHWAPGRRTLGQSQAYGLYSVETQLEDPGNGWPPNDIGGSGQEVCIAGKQVKWLDGFQVANGVQQALAALVIRPVITGVNWYTSFDTPDDNGLVAITPDATIRGGHEIVAIGIDAIKELVWFANSWGDWGVAYGSLSTGCFSMGWNTWEALLQQGGDATIPRTALGWEAPA